MRFQDVGAEVAARYKQKNPSLLSTLLTSSSKILTVVQQNVELLKQVKAKHGEFKVETSCCLRHHVARNYEDLDSWPNMLKFTVSSTKKDAVEILRVEVSHGLTRHLHVCKVCAGCIYCLPKQFVKHCMLLRQKLACG